MGYGFVNVSLGSNIVVVYNRDGNIFLLGFNSLGQHNVPTGSFKAIASGANHVCAIDNSNQVECWGNIFGTIPIDSYTDIFSG